MKRLALIPFFLLPLIVSAQEEKFKEHFIEVTGTAYREIEPNEIYVSIRLKEFEENRQKVSLEKLEKDFYNAVKEAGIDRKRVELADAGSDLEKFRRKDKEAFREKTFQIKLTSAAELEKFIEKLSPVKVDAVDVTRLHHSDYEKIKLDLKVEALKAAKSKAQTLLQSIGSEIGKPLMVRDFDFVQPYMEMKANVVMRSMEADQAVAEEPIAFRKIKMQAQITAQFEIK
ncbi:MAG TPA: SIMPL domain-containing protein [Chryseosolibacter sp.]|nr:SIMPL domain-containing protein [Chryseosolibacter sp.]